MPKTKKAAKKKAVKKTAHKKAVKSPAKKNPPKKTSKTSIKKKKATSAAKKKAVKKVAAKTAKKTVKKVNKKPVKKSAPKTAQKAPKKPSEKKPPAKKSITAKKTSKKQKTNMTNVETKTKIELQNTTPEASSVVLSVIKEDKQLDTIMDEFDIEPTIPDDNYMNDTQLEYFRKILIRWKQQLMSEVDSTMGHMQEDGLSFPDPIDRAAQEEGFNLELRTRDRERKLIKKIESALDMIETRDYGYCEDCGADIGVRRLEARPTATKCIDCKTYAEIREKQSGG